MLQNDKNDNDGKKELKVTLSSTSIINENDKKIDKNIEVDDSFKQEDIIRGEEVHDDGSPENVSGISHKVDDANVAIALNSKKI
mmetsp:Transcript_20342/g.28589  ORF Transcript_20342/g.28589 Transcript_20342/m.28589 type:complete len:84 (+) Transcript_20342:340-591(+)